MRLLATPLATMLLVVCASACASQDRKESAPAPASTAQEQPRVLDDYQIGPGDVLQVFVWRNPELSTTVPVRPDGKISTPLVEDMVAVGKTPSGLARDMEKILAEYVRTPQVNIIVSQAVSVFSQVKVVGQVRTPQAVAFREGMTVLDVVLAAGGLTEFAAGNRSRLVRTEQGKQVTIKVRLENLLSEGKLSENVPVKPGDVLVVPESIF